MKDNLALKELTSVLGTATRAGHPGGARPCSEKLALCLLGGLGPVFPAASHLP